MSFTEADLLKVNSAISNMAMGRVIRSVEAGEDKIEYKITSVEDLFRLKRLIETSLGTPRETDHSVSLYLDFYYLTQLLFLRV